MKGFRIMFALMPLGLTALLIVTPAANAQSEHPDFRYGYDNRNDRDNWFYDYYDYGRTYDYGEPDVAGEDVFGGDAFGGDAFGDDTTFGFNEFGSNGDSFSEQARAYDDPGDDGWLDV